MSDRYKVMVERITLDNDGDDTYETVAELLAPREQLARFAPGVVAEVLGAPATATGGVITAGALTLVGEQGPKPVAAPAPRRGRRPKTEAAPEAPTAEGEPAAPEPAPEMPANPAVGPAPDPAPATTAVFNPFAPK